MNNRPTREAIYIQVASLISQRGTCQRLKVGAVITFDNRIISTGYNGPLEGQPHCEEFGCDLVSKCERAIHAEENAIMFAAKNGLKLMGATIFCTHQPCFQCAKLIINSGLKNVYYKEPYRLKDGLNLLLEHGINVQQLTDEDIKKSV